ncbi:MAG: DUF72 domain-containing protein [Deltaproteobacteria bacterium]|nr:DUF72 domain-containing protein [Deltaproteobacteria bacterium]
MSEVFVGTCSWSDKSLLNSGEFYPKYIKNAEQRLKYYASVFSTVEVDSSFYAIPSEKNASLWVERTPDNFIFNIKAFSAMTQHSLNPMSLPVDLRKYVDSQGSRIFIRDENVIEEIFHRFIIGISPMIKKGKLGVVVFQYPPWFEKNDKNMDIILKAKRVMKGINCAVEFRNVSWLEKNNQVDTLNFLRDNGLTYIVADTPQVKTSKTIRYLVDCTTDIAYFRFHGRNIENWQKKGIEISLKYDYEYGIDEIKKFADDIIRIKDRVKKVFAMFNNHRGSQAVRNAMDLIKILKICMGYGMGDRLTE